MCSSYQCQQLCFTNKWFPILHRAIYRKWRIDDLKWEIDERNRTKSLQTLSPIFIYCMPYINANNKVIVANSRSIKVPSRRLVSHSLVVINAYIYLGIYLGNQLPKVSIICLYEVETLEQAMIIIINIDVCFFFTKQNWKITHLVKATLKEQEQPSLIWRCMMRLVC